MKKIDVKTWGRKSQYENFIHYTHPVFSAGTRLDVTELVEYCKEEKKSFFSCFLFLVSKAVNAVEEMRTRIIDGEPVLFDKVDPSFVVIRDDEVIVACQTPFEEDFAAFYDENRKNIQDVKEQEVKGRFGCGNRLDCFYVSCVPWIDMRSITNPYDFANVAQTSIPRITWGKFVKNEQGRYEMGFDVSAHHALIDGYQVSKVMMDIQQSIKKLKDKLGE